MGRLGFRTWTWGVGGLPSLVAWALGAVVRAWALLVLLGSCWVLASHLFIP